LFIFPLVVLFLRNKFHNNRVPRDKATRAGRHNSS